MDDARRRVTAAALRRPRSGAEMGRADTCNAVEEEQAPS